MKALIIELIQNQYFGLFIYQFTFSLRNLQMCMFTMRIKKCSLLEKSALFVYIENTMKI